MVSLREELAANFQNPFDLKDSAFFTEVVPVSHQRHNNLEPLASPLYSPISFSLLDSSPRAVPLPLSPQDIPLPLSPLALPLCLTTFNPQNHNSMAAPTIIMPARGEQAALLFDKSRPREIARFSNDLEILFGRAQIAADSDKKKFIVYYTDFETKQIWKSFRVQCCYFILSEFQRCDTRVLPRCRRRLCLLDARCRQGMIASQCSKPSYLT